MEATIECNKLFDNKIQILVNGAEVFILPTKSECDLGDLKEAFEAVAAELTGVSSW